MEQTSEQAFRQLQQVVERADPKQRVHLQPLLGQLEGLLAQRKAADEKGRTALRPAIDTALRLLEDVLDGAVNR